MIDTQKESENFTIDENERFIFKIDYEDYDCYVDGYKELLHNVKKEFVYCNNFSSLHEKKLLIESDISYHFYISVVLKSLVSETQNKNGMTFKEIIDFIDKLKKENNCLY